MPKHKIPFSPITPVHNYMTRSRAKQRFFDGGNRINVNVLQTNQNKNNSNEEQPQIEIARKIEDGEWANITADLEFNFGVATNLYADNEQPPAGNLSKIRSTTAEEDEVENNEETEEESFEEEESEMSEKTNSQDQCLGKDAQSIEEESDIDEWLSDENASADEENEDADEDEEEDEQEERKKQILKLGETELKCQEFYSKLLLEQKRMESEGISEKAQKRASNFMPAPKNFRNNLKEHQSIALRWMLWREKQGLGGILADEMGLGKTISMLALIQHEKNKNLKKAADAMVEHMHECPKKLLVSNSTLVICPASLLGNWGNEVDKKTKLSCTLFHGADRTEEPKDLIAHDIVIITYDTLLHEFREMKNAEERGQKEKNQAKLYKIPECPQSVLTRICWKRIVLDEVHHIRNKNALKSLCCMRLQADHRWVLSGTLIQNALKDLYPILRFLRIPLFANNNEQMDYKMMRQFIKGRKLKHKNYQRYFNLLKRKREHFHSGRLNVLLNVFMLARTKKEVKVSFPKLHEIDHPVVPNGIEKMLMDVVMKASRFGYQNWLDGIMQDEDKNFIDDRDLDGEEEDESSSELDLDNPILPPFINAIYARFSEMNPLDILTRLRQISVHFSLIFSDQYIPKIVEHWPETVKIFQKSHQSPKIRAIMKIVKKIVDVGDKCVIMSQWSSVLEIFDEHLASAAIPFYAIGAHVSPNERATIVEAFNSGNRYKILLITSGIGGEGLNLQGANHLIIVEPHWNPQKEKQAASRLHRIGQKKDVTIHRFIMPGTESRMQTVQKEKLATIREIFEGAKNCEPNMEEDGRHVAFVITGKKGDA